MTNRFFQFILLLISFTFLVNCEKEQPAPREYPRVRTKSVTNISEKGARFNAEVINDPDNHIEEHGFIWELSSYMSYDYAEKVLMGEMDGEGNFSYDVTFALRPDATYYLKAFIKTGDLIVFGEPVVFLSQGCLAPVITDFEPKSGVFGDTIVIYGENFSYLWYTNKVSFGNSNATVISASENQLFVIVPKNLSISEAYTISVQVNDSTAISEQTFTVINPLKVSFVEPLNAVRFDATGLYGKIPGPAHGKIKINSDNSIITPDNYLM